MCMRAWGVLRCAGPVSYSESVLVGMDGLCPHCWCTLLTQTQKRREEVSVDPG